MIDIRPATPDDAASIAAVHVASWRESYVGLMPEAILSGLSVSDRTQRWRRILDEASGAGRTAVFIAEQEGVVVGFASAGAQRNFALLGKGFSGEISAIYLLQSAQNAGVGRRLMASVAQSLRDRNHRTASLWVMKDNDPARRFYERLGGEIIAEKQDRRDATILAELAYGWRDLALLTGA